MKERERERERDRETERERDRETETERLFNTSILLSYHKLYNDVYITILIFSLHYMVSMAPYSLTTPLSHAEISHPNKGETIENIN